MVYRSRSPCPWLEAACLPPGSYAARLRQKVRRTISMKNLCLLLSIGVFALSAQTPTVITPSATAVSDSFSNYSKLNPLTPSSETDGDVEIPNQFYIPRGGANGLATSNVAVSTVTAPASTMFNQTSNGTLPVTVLSNYVGLGNGFNAWTNQGLLPPDTTLAVGNNQIVQWVNLRLTVLNKTTGALLLPGSGY